MIEINVTCDQCGEPIEPERDGHKVYCSSCADERSSISCEKCGSTIERGNDAGYCSDCYEEDILMAQSECNKWICRAEKAEAALAGVMETFRMMVAAIEKKAGIVASIAPNPNTLATGFGTGDEG